MASTDYMRILRIISEKNVNAVTLEGTLDDLYPKPFSRTMHIVALGIGMWSFLMAMVLLFTL